MIVEIIGFVAGLIYSVSALPQIIKIIRTKDTKALSVHTYVLQFLALTCWLIYGIIHVLPLFIFWTAISLSLTLVILFMKTRSEDQEM